MSRRKLEFFLFPFSSLSSFVMFCYHWDVSLARLQSTWLNRYLWINVYYTGSENNIGWILWYNGCHTTNSTDCQYFSNFFFFLLFFMVTFCNESVCAFELDRSTLKKWIQWKGQLISSFVALNNSSILSIWSVNRFIVELKQRKKFNYFQKRKILLNCCWIWFSFGKWQKIVSILIRWSWKMPKKRRIETLALIYNVKSQFKQFLQVDLMFWIIFLEWWMPLRSNFEYYISFVVITQRSNMNGSAKFWAKWYFG